AFRAPGAALSPRLAGDRALARAATPGGAPRAQHGSRSRDARGHHAEARRAAARRSRRDDRRGLVRPAPGCASRPVRPPAKGGAMTHRGFTRREFLATTAGTIGALALSRPAHAKGAVTAAMYPGTWEEAFRAHVVPALKQAHDVDLEMTPLFAVD